MGRHPLVRGRRLATATIAVALVMSVSLATPAAALSSVMITGLGGGTPLSPANAAPAGTFTTIGSAPVITETAATTIGIGTFSFAPPSGVEFGGASPAAPLTPPRRRRARPPAAPPPPPRRRAPPTRLRPRPG